ncbi:hypothetical protein HRJ34_21160 [Rhizorhabdus wittichii]|uniref:Uncharacterized protein n=1 Tax=Rhizorhabdus wittichii TaxID=160791 RepID=A0A975D0T9_9SPHN|nr:hypothetical protein [Rhizorhabdus wittichii]QTH20807.1 hypothetical protein HRJ34_21160 [Rhizorhabdus wittichii]
MTACNMIISDDRAVFLTDTALFDPDGVVVGFERKVVCMPRLGLAISLTGMMIGGPAVLRAMFRPFRTQAEALEELPDVAWAIREVNMEHCARDGRRWACDVTLAIAVYDIGDRRFSGRLLSTGNLPIRGTGQAYVPGTYLQVRNCISPAIDRHLPVEFSVIEHGRWLLERQRRTLSSGGYHSVGGMAELRIITAEGSRKRVISTWPDRVGEKIVP